MNTLSKFGLPFAAVAVLLATGVDVADAKKLRKKVIKSAPVCMATLEGRASSTGILGLGTAKARVAAVDDWSTRAAAAHGDRYASFSKARAVRWDCKKHAILLAKCVVTAKPCRK